MKHSMKMIVALAALTAAMVCESSASANEIPKYEQHFANEATFETLEEAHLNAPIELNTLTGKEYVPDPALDTYTEGTTYVYRSAGTYTNTSAAYRMNTNILVYTDKSFENKEKALDYLKELGVTELIDEACGSAVLVTPANPETGFGAVDQYDYLKLQSAMCNLGFSVRDADGNTTYYADNTYFGGLTYRYLIGIDGGADFLCDYVSGTLDYVSRVGGMLLINSSMNKAIHVACEVPVYLVNGTDEVFEKFQTVNEAYACEETEDQTVYFNQTFPTRRVAVAKNGEKALTEYVKDAYYSLFVKAMRTPVVKSGLFVPASEFSGYSWNQAPYTLTERNAVLNGVTADGIHVTEHYEDRFSAIQAENGEYLSTWYEFLPEEILNGTAKEHSIPLILCNHGGGDDPVQAVDELGLITIAGKERIALVAPRYATDVPGNSIMGASPFDVNGESLPTLVRYMLDTYPALDPERVYATGYSMGGAATVCSVECAPELFAAAVPMAAGSPGGLYVPTEEEAAAFIKYDIPMMFTTSEFDLPSAFDQTAGTIGKGYQDCLKRFMTFNEMGELNYDFEAYPLIGFAADKVVTTLLNDEYENKAWYLNNEAGIPMICVNYTELLPHGLHPDYGTLAWNFMKCYRRDTETGKIIYAK
ncbi:MAG: prolyl oligopeptidase family serine peptidase [Lachnospiraceae bacterium]|nr:prolyl oligopeptidase family serine peptidase [Lachnospiraceae bacterium]